MLEALTEPHPYGGVIFCRSVLVVLKGAKRKTPHLGGRHTGIWLCDTARSWKSGFP